MWQAGILFMNSTRTAPHAINGLQRKGVGDSRTEEALLPGVRLKTVCLPEGGGASSGLPPGDGTSSAVTADGGWRTIRLGGARRGGGYRMLRLREVAQLGSAQRSGR